MPGERKKLSKSELREDQFIEWILQASEYVRERLQLFIAGGVGVVALCLAIHLIVKAQEEARFEAAIKLGEIWMAEEESRLDDAVRLGEELTTRFEGTSAAGQAVLILANRYYAQGRYPDAQRLYQTYLDDYGQLDILVFAAWNGLAACWEAQGDLLKAAKKYQEYAAAHEGTLQASLALLEAARCYGSAGDGANQKRVLKQITKDFTNSPIVNKAREEMNML